MTTWWDQLDDWHRETRALSRWLLGIPQVARAYAGVDGPAPWVRLLCPRGHRLVSVRLVPEDGIVTLESKPAAGDSTVESAAVRSGPLAGGGSGVRATYTCARKACRGWRLTLREGQLLVLYAEALVRQMPEIRISERPTGPVARAVSAVRSSLGRPL